LGTVLAVAQTNRMQDAGRIPTVVASRSATPNVASVVATGGPGPSTPLQPEAASSPSAGSDGGGKTPPAPETSAHGGSDNAPTAAAPETTDRADAEREVVTPIVRDEDEDDASSSSDGEVEDPEHESAESHAKPDQTGSNQDHHGGTD